MRKYLKIFDIETAQMVPLENNKPVIQYMNNIVLQPMYKISQGVSNHVID